MGGEYNEALMLPNPMTPNTAIVFDEKKCKGCNKCIEVCRVGALHPNPQKGKPPIVLYPDECWFDGCCVGVCPHGACAMTPPLQQKVAWKRKDTGEFFRVGMKYPPPPNTKPPVVE